MMCDRQMLEVPYPLSDGPVLPMACEGGRRYGSELEEANPDDAEVHPVEAELARRLPQAALGRRIRAAQRRLLKALGDEAPLYLRLERLVGERASQREAALFDLGVQRGLLRGRAEALAARRDPRGRKLLRRLAAAVGPEALPVLLELAFALALEARGQR